MGDTSNNIMALSANRRFSPNSVFFFLGGRELINRWILGTRIFRQTQWNLWITGNSCCPTLGPSSFLFCREAWIHCERYFGSCFEAALGVLPSTTEIVDINLEIGVVPFIRWLRKMYSASQPLPPATICFHPRNNIFFVAGARPGSAMFWCVQSQLFSQKFFRVENPICQNTHVAMD